MKNFAIIYLVDISEVPDFNAMYELYDPCTVMFFFRNKVGAGSRDHIFSEGLIELHRHVLLPQQGGGPVAAEPLPERSFED